VRRGSRVSGITGVLGALAALTPPGGAAAGGWSLGPRPAWVLPAPEDALDPGDGGDADAPEFLLIETQTDFRRAPFERFQRVVRALRDELAVAQGSQVQIEFDPSYEDLVLHEVVVHRAGEELDRLDPAAVQLLQRETELEAQLYDGIQSALLFLDDVRKGDVLEYSFTRRGSNPVFDDALLAGLPLGWTVPVRHVRHRVLVPRERPLAWRVHGGAAQEPRERDVDGFRELVWERRDVEAIWLEDQLPDWFDALPWLQLTSFRTWGEVVAWGRGPYEDAEPSPAVAELVRELRERAGADGDPRVEAVRFVQDEVRYLGIELGPGSHRPRSPEQVLRQRFGDCKDKSLLLCALLRELGAEAAPALVSTLEAGRVAGWLPSPLAFDHVIVRARLDGEELWIDPTALLERGPLVENGNASLERGLVLAPGERDLVLVHGRQPQGPDTEVRLSFHLDGADPTVSIRTVCRGEAANAQRWSARAGGPAELERSFREFYAALYPSIESVSPPRVVDDEAANRLELHEEYRIPDFWSPVDGVPTAELYPLELEAILPAPESRQRAMPLAIPHPAHTVVTVEADLADGWDVDPENEIVENDWLRFAFSCRAEGPRLTLRWSYRSKAEHCPAAEAARCYDDVEAVRALLSYPIAFADPAGPPPGTGPLLALVVAGGSGVWSALVGLVVFLWNPGRRRPAPRMPDAPGAPGAEAGTGTPPAALPLVLAAGVFAAPPLLLGGLIRAGLACTPARWGDLAASSAEAWLRLGSLGSGVFLLGASLLVLALWGTRRRAFVPVFAAAQILLLTILIARTVAALATATEAPTLARTWAAPVLGVLWVALSVPVALGSRRVRRAFVR